MFVLLLRMFLLYHDSCLVLSVLYFQPVHVEDVDDEDEDFGGEASEEDGEDDSEVVVVSYVLGNFLGRSR